MGPLTFVLPDGRTASPLFVAPWVAEIPDPASPPVITRLRGEWPCVPFGSRPDPAGFSPAWAAALGSAADKRPLHGYGSNINWRFTQVCPSMLELTCIYPDEDDIHSLTRRIRPVPNAPAVELSLTVRARHTTRVPIGLHFTFGCAQGPIIIRPGKFRAGWTFPGPIGASKAFADDRQFDSLARVPGRGLRDLDATMFPFEEPNEDVLQLTGVEGSCSLEYPAEGYRVELAWNRAHFPSLLLWLSNRALQIPPWSGRTIALGAEPACSAFALGSGVSTHANPIAQSGTNTAIDIEAGQSFETTYWISAHPVGDARASRKTKAPPGPATYSAS
jgi:hypothetical protein